jgi:hypothetical protein
MAVYKDQKRGTWYAIYRYHDWTGKNVQKMKSGFATKKEATGMGTSLSFNQGRRVWI